MNLKVVEQIKEERNFKKRQIDPKFTEQKIGRNEPCYCKSGKKYKHCCGAL